LIVEDDADSGEALKRLLADFGYEVELVMPPAQARAASLGFLPHVAILDIGLPVISGYELVAQLRALPELSHCGYVSVSADEGDDVSRQSALAGFEQHFTKPLRVTDLLAHLAKVAPQLEA
jgi:CheY-like chemotaxis protein